MAVARILADCGQHGAQMLALAWVSSLPRNRGSVIASLWLPQRMHGTCAIPTHLRRDSSTALGRKDNTTDLQPLSQDFAATEAAGAPLALTPWRARARNGTATFRRPGGGMADAADSKPAGRDPLAGRTS